MTAEWISIGLLALLVLFFVLDVASNRRRIPRPRPVPQRKPEVAVGPAPAEAPKPEVPAADAVPGETAPEPGDARVAEAPVEVETPEVSVFERIRQGLGKTRANLTSGLADLFSFGKKIDE